MVELRVQLPASSCGYYLPPRAAVLGWSRSRLSHIPRGPFRTVLDPHGYLGIVINRSLGDGSNPRPPLASEPAGTQASRVPSQGWGHPPGLYSHSGNCCFCGKTTGPGDSLTRDRTFFIGSSLLRASGFIFSVGEIWLSGVLDAEIRPQCMWEQKRPLT